MNELAMDAMEFALSPLVKLISRGRKAELYAPPAAPDLPAALDRLAQEITVMSFNVLCSVDGTYGCRRRFNGVLRTLRGEMPDSFGLQEAHELWRWPLARALKGEYGVACNKGRLFGAHEGTPIFYRRDKYDLVREGVFWLSERPGIASIGWDASCPRIAAWAVLLDRRTGFAYAHFNTHFDHKGSIAMANSARMMADRINALGLPAVLTGDLNDQPGSLPMEYLAAGGLKDLRTSAAETDNGNTFHSYGGEGKIIDYIYANHYLRGAALYKVIRDEYDGMYPSDHFAVAATFTLANSRLLSKI